MDRPQTVFIVPGFGEGKWHAHRLLQVLEPYGYYQADGAATADVIITHSAGPAYLPPSMAATVVVMIGPSYWPGRPMWKAFLRKESRYLLSCIERRQIKYWCTKVFWNCLYIARDIPKALRRGASLQNYDFGSLLSSKHCYIIRNYHDDFCTPDISRLLSDKGPLSFQELPGEHDDCWLDTMTHAGLIDRIIREKV